MKPRKKVLFICPYPEGLQAGQRFKYEQYFDLFEKNNIEVTVSSFISKNFWKILYKPGNYFKKTIYTINGYIKRILEIVSLKNYDAVYIFMWVTPLGSKLFEKIYFRNSNKIIYDIEDNILLNFRRKDNLVAFLRSDEKIKFLIRNSNTVITSSPMLSEACSKISGSKENIKYISSSINMKRYSPYKKHIKKKNIVIGWTGTHSSIEYLNILKNVFKILKKKYHFINFKIISNFVYKLDDVTIENIEWNKFSEIQDLLEIDVAIYPLPINEWVKGKSGLKALQFMALGIPVVATKVGMNEKIIQNMYNGILVNNNDEEWILAIETLCKDFSLRNNLGKNSRKTVLENYSYDIIGKEYLKILNKI